MGEACSAVAGKTRFILTYFVNEIRLEDRATPYSFIAAPGDSLLPAEMKEDEMHHQLLAVQQILEQDTVIRFKSATMFLAPAGI